MIVSSFYIILSTSPYSWIFLVKLVLRIANIWGHFWDKQIWGFNAYMLDLDSNFVNNTFKNNDYSFKCQVWPLNTYLFVPENYSLRNNFCNFVIWHQHTDGGLSQIVFWEHYQFAPYFRNVPSMKIIPW